MNIVQEVKFFQSNKTEGCAFGLGVLWSPSVVVLGSNDTNLDFTIAHELAHIKYHHCFNEMCVDAMLAGLFLEKRLRVLIPAILIVNLIKGRIEEKQADLAACKYISNCAVAEASFYFSNAASDQKFHYLIRTASNQPFLNRLVTYFSITPNGNNLLISHFPFIDVHPAYTVRARYLRELYLKNTFSKQIFMQNATEQNALLDQGTSDCIKNMIKSSKKDSRLFNIVGIELRNSEKKNCHIICEDRTMKYSVNPEKIVKFKQDFSDKDALLSCIQEVVKTPNKTAQLLNCKIEGEAAEAADIENAIKKEFFEKVLKLNVFKVKKISDKKILLVYEDK